MKAPIAAPLIILSLSRFALGAVTLIFAAYLILSH
jgi:hypothetical protein